MGSRSMEDALARHEAMLHAVVAALEADPGGVTWQEATGSEVPREPRPDLGPGVEVVRLMTLFATETYRGADAERAVDVVAGDITGHGFAVTYRKVGSESLVLMGEDADGANATFTAGVLPMPIMTLAVTTAPHAWVDPPPGYDYVRPPILSRADGGASGV